MEHFDINPRLGIPIPSLNKDWSKYPQEIQQELLFRWEKIRGHIPDRISFIEKMIHKKQALLSEEHDFKRSCELNSEIAELASIINDLWIWYRKYEGISDKMKIHT